MQERSPSLAPAVVPAPCGLHRCWGWGGRALEVLRHEGEQVGVAQARPAAEAVLAAEGLQLVSRLWWRWSMRWAWRLRSAPRLSLIGVPRRRGQGDAAQSHAGQADGLLPWQSVAGTPLWQ